MTDKDQTIANMKASAPPTARGFVDRVLVNETTKPARSVASTVLHKARAIMLIALKALLPVSMSMVLTTGSKPKMGNSDWLEMPKPDVIPESFAKAGTSSHGMNMHTVVIAAVARAAIPMPLMLEARIFVEPAARIEGEWVAAGYL